jgi:hypothetical protein
MAGFTSRKSIRETLDDVRAVVSAAAGASDRY